MYELLFVVPPRTPPDRIVKTLKKLAVRILPDGGVIRSIDNLGVRHLAHKMKRHGNVCNEGRFVHRMWYRKCASVYHMRGCVMCVICASVCVRVGLCVCVCVSVCVRLTVFLLHPAISVQFVSSSHEHRRVCLNCTS